MFIDPVGRTYSTLGLFNRGFRTDVVYTSDIITFYTRTGDLAGNGAALTALLLLGWAWLRERGKRPPPGLEAD
jgi:apolipoprotein N-acyltransferase